MDQQTQPLSPVIGVMDELLATFTLFEISVIIVVAVAMGVYLVVTAVRLNQQVKLAAELRTVEKFEGSNDNDGAVDMFQRLLAQAVERIEVFDDGNNMEDSIYNSERVMEQLDEKLTNFPQFEAVFFFNADDPLLLKERFRRHERVHIYAGAAGVRRDPSEVHYKIIDNGKLAYLSTHLYGDDERKFEILDCRKVQKNQFDEVVKVKFGGLKNHAHRQFPEYHQAEATA